MGMLSKLVAANLTARIVKRLNAGAREPAPRQEYIPARPTFRDRATTVARQNPKTLAALGALIAAVAVQQALKRR